MVQKSLSLISRVLHGLACDTRGQMSVVVALCSLPLAVSSGITFDYTKSAYARTQLVVGLTEAALIQFEENPDQPATWHQAIKEHLETTNPPSVIGSLTALSLQRDGDHLRIFVESRIETSVLDLVGIDSLKIEAEVSIAVPKDKTPLIADATELAL